ncbi:MAG: hypothetical protein J5615_03840 [Fibrobacter sp.]|nr:hypothetical protein [Fibrobacter sp.]
MNDPDGESWDLRSFLHDGGRSKTWAPVARWLKGIYALPRKLSFEETDGISTDARGAILRSIICMNLKKYGGGASTKNNELKAVAEANRDLLNKQFELYSDVDYVICCGPDVKKLAKKLIVPIRNAESWLRMPETTVEYLEFAPQKYAIGFWHPQQRKYKHDVVYNWLIDTIAVLENRKRK